MDSLSGLIFPVWFLSLVQCKGKLVVYGDESSGLWGFLVWMPKPVWKCVGGCVALAVSSSVEVELQVLTVLEGVWALCAQTGNCSSPPWSSCWQILACLYYHPCLSVHVDSFFFSYSADINYERLTLRKLDLPALPLLRRFECCNTA